MSLNLNCNFYLHIQLPTLIHPNHSNNSLSEITTNLFLGFNFKNDLILLFIMYDILKVYTLYTIVQRVFVVNELNFLHLLEMQSHLENKLLLKQNNLYHGLEMY